MAEDEDGISNKISSHNSNNDAISEENEQTNPKPDLGIEEAKYNSNENEDSSSVDAKSSSSKSSSATRKDENPFSFRHFLKRDLSLPSNSTYESTGARPKVYANTVQHSPNKIDIASEARRGKARPENSQTKNKDKLKLRNKDGSVHQLSDNTTSSSSIEVPFSVVDNSESKHNLFINSSDTEFYQRPNLASEPLGMPSLPDFVQDHILVEQAYLNSNGPISVDLDNLPDFTFNTNFNAGSSSSLGRRNNSREYRNYDYAAYGASTSESGPSESVPLDLPEGVESGAPPLPLDLPPHLNLDLTESVNPADRRNNSPRSTFPLDLPGAETMRLPDFLPPQRARDSPPPEPIELQQVMQDLERTRSELFAERSRRSRLESELATARAAAAALRGELATSRRRARTPDSQEDPSRSPEPDTTVSALRNQIRQLQSRSPEPDTTVSALRNQIRQLQEQLSVARSESATLLGRQSRAARDLRQASTVAETSLRELLFGIEQLKSLSTSLDPP